MPREISLREIDLSDFTPGMRVLDLGCGEGRQVETLVKLGCDVVGIDPCPETVARCRVRGLNVIQASGERLPFEDGTFDAVISRVVLPYTDERQVIAEAARVLRTGGRLQLSGHGLAYHPYDVIQQRSFKRCLYAARSMVNACLYRSTGRRLPGFLGDTLYQSRRAIRDYFVEYGLLLRECHPHETVFGLPVFVYFAADRIEQYAARRASAG